MIFVRLKLNERICLFFSIASCNPLCFIFGINLILLLARTSITITVTIVEEAIQESSQNNATN